MKHRQGNSAIYSGKGRVGEEQNSDVHRRGSAKMLPDAAILRGNDENKCLKLQYFNKPQKRKEKRRVNNKPIRLALPEAARNRK